MKLYLYCFLCISSCFVFVSCGTVGSYVDHGLPVNRTLGEPMGGPTPEQRKEQIATEPTGDFFYGRRYYVMRTRFWGYLRKPGKSWKTANLVMFNESKKKSPDRYPETGSSNKKYGFDANYEYRIHGHYTGKKVYDPNSNKILDEFVLTNYKLINKKPGWLFTPKDRLHVQAHTLAP